MTPRRRLLATAFAAVALTACEAPAPIVTVVNAGRSVYAEANVYCFEGQSLDERNCAIREQGATQLAVIGELPVGIDVGKELADTTWTVEVRSSSGGDSVRSDLQRGHYFAFQVPRLPEQGSSLLLTVQALDDQQRVFGEWRFDLVARE